MRFLRVSAGSVGSSLGPIRNALCIYKLYYIGCHDINRSPQMMEFIEERVCGSKNASSEESVVTGYRQE
jgi:hypothetical protein